MISGRKLCTIPRISVFHITSVMIADVYSTTSPTASTTNNLVFLAISISNLTFVLFAAPLNKGATDIWEMSNDQPEHPYLACRYRYLLVSIENKIFRILVWLSQAILTNNADPSAYFFIISVGRSINVTKYRNIPFHFMSIFVFMRIFAIATGGFPLVPPPPSLSLVGNPH